MTLSRFSVNRSNTLRGREAISAFFAIKRNIRLPYGCVIRAAYTATISEDAGINVLIVVSKRIAKRAHDRNQVKRWVRAAIAETSQFSEIDAQSKENGIKLILLISPNGPPSSSVNWESILGSIQETAAQIQNSNLKIQPSRAKEIVE